MADTDQASPRRLDGWKAIANYFRRDRSTVMRWARERDLPVRRMPGGKQGSVFAFEHELATWSLSHDTSEGAAAPEITTGVTPALVRPAARVQPLWAGLIAFVVLVMIAGTIFYARGGGAPQDRMPANPAVAADYIAARDAWARRTPADLVKAIGMYRNVIRRDPDFAPAHAGLAEAWLIYREYGAVGDFTAYRAAEAAAKRAIELDPRLPSAHRALGFIQYWRNNDPVRATASFRRALALDDRDAQTHFWYANVLSDLGDDQTAQSEYSRARLLSPGSQPIEVEQACSHWQAGRDAQALRDLSALKARYPDDATIRNCLAWVHISGGNIAGFADEYDAAAKIRGEADLLRMVADLRAAMQRDPTTAHRAIVAIHERQIAAGERNNRETPAFFASAMGDRTLLATELKRAVRAGEHWSSATIRKRIAARWNHDAEIESLLRAIGPVPGTSTPSPVA